MIGGGRFYRGGVEYIRCYRWITVFQKWSGPRPCERPFFFSVEKMGKAEGVSDSKAEAGDDLRHQELWGGDGEEEAVRRGVLNEAGAENGEDVRIVE